MTTRQWTPSAGRTTLQTPEPAPRAAFEPTSDPASAGTMADTDSDHSIAALIARLSDQARQFAQAELRLARAIIVDRVISARAAALCLVLALVLVQAAFIALLIGLILALVPLVGALGATGIVAGGAVVVAGVLAWIALRQIRAATRIEEGQ